LGREKKKVDSKAELPYTFFFEGAEKKKRNKQRGFCVGGKRYRVTALLIYDLVEKKVGSKA
jgi:hypothetical protein